MLTVAMVAGGALFVAGPAAAEHVDGYYCGDTPTANVDDSEMTNDTPTACIVSGSGGGGEEGGDGAGGVGAVPTRIDTGAGGAANGANVTSIGAVLTGLTAAAGAAVAAGRRRRP